MPIDRVTGLTKENYGFDELVATDARVHIERMHNGHVWMDVESGGKRVILNFHVQKQSLWVNVEEETTDNGTDDR